MTGSSRAGAVGSQSSGDNQAAATELARQAGEYAKRSVTVLNPADVELWSIVSDVPRLQGVWPYVCAILNVVLPGVGTMIAACIGYTLSWSKTQLMAGLLQMLTAVYIVGWAWSIYWAWLFLAKALRDKQEVNRYLNQTNVRSE